jgi:hypothetical protein
VIQIKKDTKLNTKKIGADRADFDLDVIEVKIKKKLLERCIDVVVTLLVAIVAVTVATVFIIPLFG